MPACMPAWIDEYNKNKKKKRLPTVGSDTRLYSRPMLAVLPLARVLGTWWWGGGDWEG